MRAALLSLLLVGAAAGASAKPSEDWPSVDAAVRQLTSDAPALKAPETPPARREELERQRTEGLGRIDAVADRHASHAPTQAKVASAFLAVHEPARALSRAEKAVALAPQDPVARTVHGQANFELGRVAEAAADARQALALDPENKMAQALLSLSAGRSGAGNAAPAAPAAKGGPEAPGGTSGKSDRPAPGAAPAQGYAGTAAAQGAADRIKAQGFLGDALRKLSMGDEAAAKPLLARAAALDPKNAKIRVLKSKNHLALKESREALSEAKEAAAIDPRSGAARLAVGEAKEATGASPVDFLPDFKAAGELDPSLAGAYESAMGRYRKAVETRRAEVPEQSAGQSGAPGDRAPGVPPIVEGESMVTIAGWRLPLKFASYAALGTLGLLGLIAFAMVKAWKSGLEDS